jgi:hypothetical protein
MPREWGRDPFFTFMARERNEGLGDVHAFVAKFQGNSQNNFKVGVGAGYIKTPDVRQAALNKYGMPSYVQFNGDVRYKFKGYLKGLESQFLIASKLLEGNTYENSRYIINKVNVVNYNLVLNYYF